MNTINIFLAVSQSGRQAGEAYALAAKYIMPRESPLLPTATLSSVQFTPLLFTAEVGGRRGEEREVRGGLQVYYGNSLCQKFYFGGVLYP